MKISKTFHEHLNNSSNVSKTFKTIVCVACFLLMLPVTSQAQEDENFMLNLTEFTIKFGHDADFVEGVKKWNKCYKDNNGTETWNVWNRVQGKGNVYILSARMNNWAEMDKTDEAGKACRSIAMESIIPHIESSEFNIASFMPDYSRKTNLEGMTIVWVYNFKVNNRMAFNEVVKEVTSTIAKKEGSSRGYWYSLMGGQGSDYFVSTPFTGFADLDKDTDSVWKVYASVHGESKTKQIREKFNAALDDSWSYTYTLVKDLSMQ